MKTDQTGQSSLGTQVNLLVLTCSGSNIKIKYSSVFRENRCAPPPKPVYGGNFSHEAVTLKIRSRSSKPNKLLILSDLYRLANLVTFHPMVHEMQTNTFWLNFGGLSLKVTLKIRSRSPKSIQLCIMSKCYIHANLVKIRQLVYDIVRRSTFLLKFGSLSPALTLKNRSRSPKSKQFFIMSQCYIHANLVEICQPVPEIWCTQALGLKFGSLRLAVTLKI